MKRLLPLLAILMLLLSACGARAQEPEAPAAPDFTLPNATGTDISLNDYNGKNVLLFFHMAVG